MISSADWSVLKRASEGCSAFDFRGRLISNEPSYAHE